METNHIVTDNSGLIVNRIVKDENTPSDWSPGTGLTVWPETIEGAIGGSYIDGVYTPPAEPEELENEGE